MLYLESMMSLAKILHAFFLFLLIVNSYGESIGVFDDNILFDISWPGLLPKNDALEVDTKVEVQVVASQSIYPSGCYCRRKLRMKMQTSGMAILTHWL